MASIRSQLRYQTSLSTKKKIPISWKRNNEESSKKATVALYFGKGAIGKRCAFPPKVVIWLYESISIIIITISLQGSMELLCGCWCWKDYAHEEISECSTSDCQQHVRCSTNHQTPTTTLSFSLDIPPR